jgi:hypothetical protein
MVQGRGRSGRSRRLSGGGRAAAVLLPRHSFVRLSVLTKVSRQSNTNLVSHIDCPGGGQVWVEGTTLYVGHMRPTSGTTIIDIADPRSPRILSHIPVRDGWHSHKVRVSGDIMLVNQEKFGKSAPTDVGGGLDIYNVRIRRIRN